VTDSFSDTTWGKATHGYTKSACALANTKFETIVKDTQEFMKPISAYNRDPMEVIDIDDNDSDNERACLVDNSSSEAECMWFSSFMILLTRS
jgi:hypothetical protein